MTQTIFSIKVIQLQEDAKDIKIEYLVSTQLEGINTYIIYVSESHPHKHCVYVVYGKWELAPNTVIENGKLQLIEMF